MRVKVSFILRLVTSSYYENMDFFDLIKLALLQY